MKHIYKIILLVIVLININNYAKSQDFTNALTNNIFVYNNMFKPVKIYLHIDKTLYKQGDYVWFKIYTTNGVNNKLSVLNNTVIVDFIDPKGSIIETKEFFIEKGTSYGYFKISDITKGGLYKIKAYSQWQQNIENTAIFEKEITIQKVLTPNVLLKMDFDREAYGPGQIVIAKFNAKNLVNKPLENISITAKVFINNKLISEINQNTDSKGNANIEFKLPDNLQSNDGLVTIKFVYNEQSESITRSIPIVLNNIDLSFFPEGGNIVANTTNRIAFEALNEFGLPADIEGVILDQNNNVVTNFKSFHQGMGAFEFVPKFGTKYKAKILKPKELSVEYDLPQVYETGFVLSFVEKKSDSFMFNVFSSVNSNIYLAATIRDSLYFIKNYSVKSGENDILLPTSNFNDGIVRITLFDETGYPMCERLVYFGQMSPMKIEINSDENYLGLNQLTEIEIITTVNNKPVSAELSMAIVDDKILSFIDDKQDNILSWTLMSSEVKGKIYEPSFYFNQNEPKAAEALDYLLMTHGWRRYNWIDVLTKQPVLKIPYDQTRLIIGQTTDKNGAPIPSNVWLFEANNLKRAVMLETTKDGYFIFDNVDNSSNIKLVAQRKKKAKKDVIIKEIKITDLKDTELLKYISNDTFNIVKYSFVPKNLNLFQNDNNTNFIDSNNIPEIIEPKNIQNTPVNNNQNNNNNNNNNQNNNNNKNNQDLNESDDFGNYVNDDTKVDEVVVTALGISRDEKKLGYSVTNVNSDFNMSSLSGKVSGVYITNSSGAPGQLINIAFNKNIKTFNDFPLVVLNGMPLNYNTSIQNSIEILTQLGKNTSLCFKWDYSATYDYGFRGINGVLDVQILQSANSYYSYYETHYLNELAIPAKNFNNNKIVQVEYYNPKDYWQKRNEAEIRNSTVYWNPNITTDENGKAKIQLYTPDELSTYRITVEGVSIDGNVGRAENNINIVKPVSLESKVPYELSYNDTMILSLIVKNSTKKIISGISKINLGKGLELISSNNINTEVKPDSIVKVQFIVKAKTEQSSGIIEMNFENSDFKESVKYDYKITPKGFPIQSFLSGNDLENQIEFQIEKPLEGSIQGSFQIYPNILNDLTKSVEGMLRQPGGCFEQVSSSTYPNILVLQVLRENNSNNQDLDTKAINYIKDGYRRLTAYETSENGYSIWGDLPANESLTAYGILEFTDMSKVWNGVENNMMERTKKWILSKKKGNGSFKTSSGVHGFTSYENINNAYIIFALAKAGLPISDIEKEYNLAFDECLKSKDLYRLGLMANASYFYNKTENLDLLVSEMTKIIDKIGYDNLTAEASITYSYGNSLKVEIASLYILALLNQNSKDVERIQKGVDFIYKNKSYGYYCSTQGTIMALSALVQYSKFFKQSLGPIKLKITVNGNEIYKEFDYSNSKGFKIDSLEKFMTKNGKQKVSIEFLSSNKVPYSFSFKWNTLKITTDQNCKVSLKTELANKSTKVGDNVRMNITIKNKTNGGIPMTIAEIGIPAGLSLQPWQLKELTDKNVWDYYEIFDGKLVIYFNDMLPNEVREIKLDLKADIAGYYTARASSAYLYYTNEYKDWQEGTQIKITE